MGTTKTDKKILIYSPYWQMLGGGERYLLQVAKALEGKFRIFLLADKKLLKRAKDTFGLDLNKMEFISPSLFTGQKFYSRYFFIRQFDICFYTTDGSLFFPAAKKNYLIIQSPKHIPKINLSSNFKISGWKILCYSSFMQKVIMERLKKKSTVLPPAVDINQFKNSIPVAKKEKIFLTVGRFFASSLHEKKPDFLINFFRRNYKEHFYGWKLLICGNLTEESGRENINALKKSIIGYPIVLKVNLPFKRLVEIYAKSKLYWHATGVGFDPQKFPEKMEHFGITTIEAMSSGAVPVVYEAGGQTDIIEPDKSGFFWKDEETFLTVNKKLIENKNLLVDISKNAVNRAVFFSFENFRKRIEKLV